VTSSLRVFFAVLILLFAIVPLYGPGQAGASSQGLPAVQPTESSNSSTYWWSTATGTYYFPRLAPYIMIYQPPSWTNLTGISFSAFWLNESGTLPVPAGSAVNFISNTTFSFSATLWSAGTLTETWNFSTSPPKASVTFTPTSSFSYNIIWAVASAYTQVWSPSWSVVNDNVSTSLGTTTFAQLGQTQNSLSWSAWVTLDWSDYGPASVSTMQLSLFGSLYGLTVVSFGQNVSRVDPSASYSISGGGSVVTPGFSVSVTWSGFSGCRTGDTCDTVIYWEPTGTTLYDWNPSCATNPPLSGTQSVTVPSGASPGQYYFQVAVLDCTSPSNTQTANTANIYVETYSLSNSGGITVTQGNAGSNTITVTVSGYNSNCNTITLSASGLPSGASAAFSPSSGGGTCSSFSSTLTISTSGSTPTGSYGITVTGSMTGSNGQTTTFTLTVNPSAPTTVNQPITLTLAAGSPTTTATLSGCSVSPTSLAGDGAAHTVTATASCTITITLPAGTAQLRYVNPSNGSTYSLTTCASGTCAGASFAYYLQFNVTFASNPAGGGTTTPSGQVWMYYGNTSISASANSGYSFSSWVSNTSAITFSSPSSTSTNASVTGFGLITAQFSSTVSQWNISIFQEEYPTQLNTNTLYVQIIDSTGNSTFTSTSNGQVLYNSTGGRPATIVLTQNGTALTRVYQGVSPTQTGGSNYSVWYPQYVGNMVSYSYFFNFANASFVTVSTVPGGITIENVTIPSPPDVGIPLLYGHQYSFVVTLSGGTSFTATQVAGSLTSITILLPSVTYSPNLQTESWEAVWNTGSNLVTLTFYDPNGISGNGDARLLSSTGTLLFETPITSANWTYNIILPYQFGMVAFFSAQDSARGSISGYTTVQNTSTSVTLNPYIPVLTLPDVGLGTMFGYAGGFSDGANGWYTLIALVTLLAIAAAFSERHQDMGGLVVVGVAAFFSVILQWAGSLSIFLTAATTVAFLQFFKRRATNL
jgi:hypothetical protein